MDDQDSLKTDEWVETKLGHIIKLSKEKIHPSECPATPYISLEHIESGSNKIKEHGLAQDVKSTKSIFNGGDILYGRLRPYLNKVFMPDFSGICSTDILVLKTTDVIENRFLLKFLSQKNFVHYAHANSSGINLPRISFNSISEYPIKLPPIDEQRRISNKIEILQTKSKKAKQALESAKPLLDKLRQSILASAFRGDLTAGWRKKNPDVEPASFLLERIRKERRKKWEENELAKMKAKGKEPKDDKWKSKYKEPGPANTEDLPELPEAWCWVRLEEICNLITDGTHQPPQFVDNGIPFIVIRNITNGYIDWDSVGKWVSEDTFQTNSKRFIPEEGDILYSAVGTYGIAVEIRETKKFMFQRHIAFIKPVRQSGLTIFLTYALNSPYILKQAHAVARGVAQKTVTLESLRNFIIPLAPEREQIVISRKLSTSLKHTKSLNQTIGLSQKNLEIIDQSILLKAFQGEIVQQDSNDEPASVFPEKIKKRKGKMIRSQK